MKRRDTLIKGDRIYLRELTEEDASREYCSWINDSEVNKFLDTKKATVGQLRQYIREKTRNKNCLFWGIFTNSENKHIGNIKLEPIDWAGKKATLGILLGDKNYWGQGLGTDVVKLTTDYAFKELGLKKVELGVVSENKAAIKCYQKVGFNVDKTQPKAIKFANKLYDKIIMSITRLDFVKAQKQTEIMEVSKGPDLYEKAKKIIPGGTQLLSKRPEMFLPNLWPAYYRKAEGCEVWDLDSNKYVDMSYMGLGACVLGYADRDVGNSVKNAVDSGSMTTLNCPEEIELAELLCEIHPWAGMVRYARTGGEAMAVAVRIARAKTEKDLVLFCGYHGWQDWYLSANLADDKALDGHLLPGLEPRGVPRALKGTSIAFNYNDTKEFLALIDKYKNKISAVVMEPVRNHYPEGEFLKIIRETTQNRGIILIFDEITSGWRLCMGGAHLELGVEPDIAVFAKAISNGYPMAAIIGKAEVMDVAQDTFISSTYWTERIGPTAALATINKLKEKNVSEHLISIGKEIQQGWERLAQKHHLKITISGIYPLGHFSFEYKNPMVLKTLFTQLMLEQGFLATTAFYASYAHQKVHVQEYVKAVDISFGFISKALEEGNPEKYLKGPVCSSGFKRLT